MAFVVSVGALGWPPSSDAEVRNSDIYRDIEREKVAAISALSIEPEASDHLRPPGAVVLILPVLLLPSEFLAWSAAAIAIVGVGFLVTGARRLAGRRGVALAICVPTSVAFTQGIVHGSLFVIVAAALVWAWVNVEEQRWVVGGILLGLVGTARLWPLLLLAPLLLGRLWKPLLVASGVFVTLNLAGLLLPGVSLEGTLTNLGTSTDSWIFAAHNGAIAGWLAPLGEWAVLTGFVVVLAVWAVGLTRVKTVSNRIGWSLPAALLASPLAWLPYLLALAPIAAVYGNRGLTRAGLVASYVMLAVGYLIVANRLVVTLVAVVAMVIVWIEAPDAPAPRRSEVKEVLGY